MLKTILLWAAFLLLLAGMGILLWLGTVPDPSPLHAAEKFVIAFLCIGSGSACAVAIPLRIPSEK